MVMFQFGMGVEGEEFEEDEEIFEQNVVYLIVVIIKGFELFILEFGCVV